MGRSEESLFARSLGFELRLDRGQPPQPAVRCCDRCLQCCTPAALALDLVEPAGRVVYIGLAGSQKSSTPGPWSSRTSPRLAFCRPLPASAPPSRLTAVWSIPVHLVAATVSLEQVGAVLAGDRPEAVGRGPKIHVDPQLA